MPAGDGPLTGLRFACKDNMAVAGQILTNGCHAWSEMKTSGRPAPQTAPCVMSALRAGAELVGHTVMDQLAYSLQGNESDFPTPTNPRHPSLLPGGSR